jgi:hypothetical protein
MLHGQNAIYYAQQNRPGMAIKEAGVALRDAVTGSRK